VVGSLAYGGVHPASDLDLLVVSYPGKRWSEVSAIAAAAARPYDVPVDVVFADTLPPAVRSAMLKDARRAGECEAFPTTASSPRRARRPGRR
jgi:predicted nucleotidyltransferase